MDRFYIPDMTHLSTYDSTFNYVMLTYDYIPIILGKIPRNRRTITMLNEI